VTFFEKDFSQEGRFRRGLCCFAPGRHRKAGVGREPSGSQAGPTARLHATDIV